MGGAATVAMKLPCRSSQTKQGLFLPKLWEIRQVSVAERSLALTVARSSGGVRHKSGLSFRNRVRLRQLMAQHLLGAWLGENNCKPGPE